MIKALFKKQMLETFSGMFGKKKDGTRRDKGGLIGMAIFYVVIFGFLGVSFYLIAKEMCAPLCSVGLGWLYFVIVSLLSIVFGIFGSVFSTYSSLYKAKDNDMLLSMPIKPSNILLMRLSGVYAVGLLYELIVMIPAVIAWIQYGSLNVLAVIFSILIPIVSSFFILVMSCVLGFVVAAVSSKIKNKNIVTVVLSISFIVAYYFLYSKVYDMLMDILTYADRIAKGVKNILYPFYHMGLAAEGKPLSMLIYTAMVAVLLLAVCFILSKSFLKLATANKGERKKKYRETKAKSASVDTALFKRELKRFTGSPAYMLNCGLGLLFMVVAAVAIVVKGRDLRMITDLLFGAQSGWMALIIAALLCLIATMVDITAPSVSLEGKNLWLIRVMPVSGWRVLRAKLLLHLALISVPTVALLICAIAVFRPTFVFSLLIILTVAAFEILMAEFGLVINVKKPNLDWTNEIVPIKQSMSVVIAMFGGMAVVAALVVLYFVVRKIMTPLVYLICACALLIGAAAGLFVWLRKRGGAIFEKL